MTVRRLPFAAAALALLGATACEKPAPQITVASSGRVVNVDATRYCFDECREHTAAVKSIRVRGNTTVSFDVPKRVAKRGWLIATGDQPPAGRPRTESHFTLSVPTTQDQDQPLPVTIIEGADPSRPTGEWRVQFLIEE